MRDEEGNLIENTQPEKCWSCGAKQVAIGRTTNAGKYADYECGERWCAEGGWAHQCLEFMKVFGGLGEGENGG
jgi:hypothetical protein